jgi:hypothetical protein
MPQKRDPSSETKVDNESLETNGADDRSRLADAAPIGRRGCLRLAGATLAGAAAIGATGTAAAQENVHASDISGTYEVSSGEEVRILVGQNQYGDYGDLENVLIDAAGADVQIKSFGDDWAIRNVGIEGPTEGTNPVIDLKTDGGSGVVENVYLGDGGSDGQPGIFVKKEHSGTVTIRDCYVGDFRDNGIYASTPGKGGGGATRIENCYGENNGRAHFRIGGDGSYVKDSVAYTDEDTLTSRGVWARRDDADVENTDIALTDSSSATSAIWATGGASVDYRNSDYRTTYSYGDFEGNVDTSDVGSDPSTSPPSGVPTSAAEAAGGSASSSSSDSDDEDSSSNDEGSSEDSSSEEGRGGEGEASSEMNEETDGEGNDSELSNTVTLRSETGEEARYEFTVEDDVEATTGDDASGSTASGAVTSYRDGYEFSGEFTEFRYSGPIVIDVNGETVYRASDA